MKKTIVVIILGILLSIDMAGCRSTQELDEIETVQKATLTEEPDVDSKSIYNEAPQLAAMVINDELPSVEERLPTNPMLIQPVERVGVYGGTWRMGALNSKDTGLFVRTFTYENLVQWDANWTKTIPNIAQSVEVNKDSTAFTFTLREGMRWSDGHPFTSSDILFYYEWTQNQDFFPNGPPDWLAPGGESWEVEILSDTSFIIRFSQPYGLFLQYLAFPRGADITSYPRHYLEQFLPENSSEADIIAKELGFDNWQHRFNHSKRCWWNPEIPTLHAWVFSTAYEPNDSGFLNAHRNPYYWKIDTNFQQLPYIDELHFTLAESADELVKLATAGKIDMQIRHINKPENQDLYTKSLTDYWFVATKPSDMNEMVIQFNLTHPDPVKRKIFLDKDFRVGLSLAINRQRIIDQVFTNALAPYQAAPRPESHFYNEKLATQYTDYDPDLAREYLDQAGLTEKEQDGFRKDLDGNSLTITIEVADVFNKDWPEALKLIKEDWEAVGIRTIIEEKGWQELDESRNFATHDALVWSGTGGLDVILTPGMYFPGNAEAGYGMKWVWWYSPNEYFESEVPPLWAQQQMELYDQIKATADTSVQDELMMNILEIAAEEFHTIGIAVPGNGYGIVSNRMHNVPKLLPYAWTYPSPAPTNPCQYFIVP